MLPSPPIRVAVVDDHPLVRLGVRAVLTNEPDMALVGEASTGAEALELIERCTPDVILLDFLLPDVNALDLLQHLRALNIEVRVVLVTAHIGDDDIRAAFSRGASGVLLKHTASESLCACIRQVRNGDYWLDRAGVVALLKNPQAEGVASGALRGHQQAIVDMVGRGSSNKQIAAALGLGEQTVKNYLRQIFRKLNVQSRVQLALYAARNRLIRPRRLP